MIKKTASESLRLQRVILVASVWVIKMPKIGTHPSSKELTLYTSHSFCIIRRHEQVPFERVDLKIYMQRIPMQQNDSGIFALVGNTPIMELKNITAGIEGVSVFVKAEHLNPSGSVKDRAARGMILHGIQSGQLSEGKVILDSTSGNTGVAYAMFGAALGYKVQLFMPSNASAERKTIIKAYGAEIIETDPMEGSDGAYNAVLERAKGEPEKYFFPNQYDNDENWRTHYETTGLELYAQCQPTHFVAGTGTSGTFMGISRRLKRFNPAIQIALMQPDSPFHGLEGMKYMDATIKPKIFDASIADIRISVSTENAYKTARQLAKEEGLFVGISSGANVYAALELAKTLPQGSRIATILCDTGCRYLSEPLWRDLDKHKAG